MAAFFMAPSLRADRIGVPPLFVIRRRDRFISRALAAFLVKASGTAFQREAAE